MNEEYKKALRNAAALCQELGHTVEAVSLKINHADVSLALLVQVAAETAEL